MTFPSRVRVDALSPVMRTALSESTIVEWSLSIAPRGISVSKAFSKYLRMSSDLVATVLLPVPMKSASLECNFTSVSTSEALKALFHCCMTSHASSLAPPMAFEESANNNANLTTVLNISAFPTCDISNGQRNSVRKIHLLTCRQCIPERRSRSTECDFPRSALGVGCRFHLLCNAYLYLNLRCQRSHCRK